MRAYLKTLREQSNQTQEEIAKQMKCSRQSYNLIENGIRQKSLRAETIFKLAKILNVPATYILEQEQRFESTG